MLGLEWIYHYKEMHYKIFYNQIFYLENEQENIEINNRQTCYGLGVTFTSPFGPSIGRVKIPENLIVSLNNYVDEIIKDENKLNELNFVNNINYYNNILNINNSIIINVSSIFLNNFKFFN